MSEISNLEIASISMNQVSSLKVFQNMQKLQELYLRKNQIYELGEVYYLQKLHNLRILWLSHNPCADQVNYRAFVIKTLPQLVKLDETEITEQERLNAKLLSFDHVRNPLTSSQVQNSHHYGNENIRQHTPSPIL